MRVLVFLATFVFAAATFAQIEKPGEKKPCYAKADARKGKRFTEWECGKIAGIVDCNEKLDWDEASETSTAGIDRKPFNGTCETCHMNGILERRVTFVNGKTNGVDTTYYESGCIMVVRNHVQGEENGQWTFFYDSTAMPAWEMNYSVGQQNGRQVFYSPPKKDARGVMRSDTMKYENYVNGVLNGQKISYDANGKRTKQAIYKNGLLEGPFLVFNAEGKIIEELNYKEGKKNGVFKYYYDDGELLRTESWDMDSRNGEFKTFYYDKSLQTLENYKKNPNPKPEKRYDAEIYVCPDKEIAQKVYEMLGEKKTNKDVQEEFTGVKSVTYLTEKTANPEVLPYLNPNKLQKGLNEPTEYEKKYYVIYVKGTLTLFSKEYKEGWFEEYFPNKKPKRRALYRKDILIEEHVFDENGREIKTFGGEASKGAEDDEVPGAKKPAEKKKKEKKPKGKKTEEPSKPE
jgi:antitoxin component YwqK of YwqJK toxin-antitoxin module